MSVFVRWYLPAWLCAAVGILGAYLYTGWAEGSRTSSVGGWLALVGWASYFAFGLGRRFLWDAPTTAKSKKPLPPIWKR